MGRLKSGITDLKNALAEAEPRLTTIEDTMSGFNTRMERLVLQTDQGYDVLYLFLIETFKRSGSTAEAHANDTLKSIGQPALLEHLKAIVQWKSDLKRLIVSMNEAVKEAWDDLENKLLSAETKALVLKKLAKEKQGTISKKPNYKKKIEDYLVSLDHILTILKSQIARLKASRIRFSDEWVETEFPVRLDLTVGWVKMRQSADGRLQLQWFAKYKEKHDQHVHQWRDGFKALPVQLALMKKWIDEADQMEGPSAASAASPPHK